MKRWLNILARVSSVMLACITTLISISALAETPESVPRIGYLLFSSLTDTPSPERAGFLQGLRELGYEDGKNIVIEYRTAHGDPETLPFLADELVELKVKAIVVLGSPTIRAIREVSTTIPIVMIVASDPVRLGFAKSLARPGSNVTGMTHIPIELGAKRLQILKTVAPGVKHAALVLDKTNPGARPELENIQSMGRQLGIRVSTIGLPDNPDDDALRARLMAARPDAIMTIIDPRVSHYRRFLPQFALEQRIPAMFDWKAFVEEGGLMSYGPDFADMARRAAIYVDKILKGADPAELPIEQPTEIQLTLNLKTAKALGLNIPDSIRLRADRVME